MSTGGGGTLGPATARNDIGSTPARTPISFLSIVDLDFIFHFVHFFFVLVVVLAFVCCLSWVRAPAGAAVLRSMCKWPWQPGAHSDGRRDV